MTQANDVPTRLDRIEAVLEQLVDRTNENTQQLAITMQAIDRLATVQSEPLQAIAASQRDISEMQSEVRGLQTENRRILDVLQNQDGNNSWGALFNPSTQPHKSIRHWSKWRFGIPFH
jgi:chromosome segregation ATPase